MAEKSFDIIVLGGGPGGYTAAIRAAQLGFNTGIIEAEKLGGICLNWGCIPTKALLKNAEILHQFKKASEWGISYDNLKFDFGKIIQRSRGISDKISKGVEFLMKKNKIDYMSGYGTLQGNGVIEVKPKEGASYKVSAKHIIVATGARARSIPGVTIDRKRIITSTEAMSLSEQPKSMIVVGAGAIGIEFAYFYNALGTKVTVVEMMPGILPIEDRELTKEMERSFKKQGIEILTDTKVESVKSSANDVVVVVNTPEGMKELKGDVALMAIGVQGNVEGFGLEKIGVTVERNHIKVDKDYRTNVPGVYAIGDVIGAPWLAHVASAEGIHCVEAIKGMNLEPIDYSMIPGCTYCQPQIASVGLTEEKAKAEGYELKIGKFPFRPLGKAIAIGETEGMVKLIFDAKYGELLGAHIMGSEATEMIAELALAKKLEATGKSIFHTIHAHPTLSEAVMEAAAAAYGEAINI
ncbi:MAG: dihydrolipoyl dehydrogenase [Bacteroidetes bacterium]|nr:dihydrolipoyl dehydrogenase [Bacteroidota bacterium]MCW5897195.1 dihydrolipoyl dehydrogenase [Bacteroidota bacterium]